MSEEKSPFNSFRRQYYAVIVANLAMFSHSCYVGWYTPVLPLLVSENTPLPSGPLSLQEMSWIGSLFSISAAFGSLIAGFFIVRFGVKRLMVALSFAAIISWLLVIFATTSYHLALSRVVSGVFGIGLEQCLVLYVSEIADDRIRGALSAMQLFSRSAGFLAAFIVGAFTEYSTIPYVFIGLPCLFIANFALLPNTPKYLVQNGKFAEARESLKYYKNCKGQTPDETNAIEMELQRLQKVSLQSENKNRLTFKEFRNPPIYRGIIIGMVLATLNQLCGCFTFMTYGVKIFEESGTHIDPQLANITLGVLQCTGNLCTTQLVDKIGRRLLLVISVSGAALGLSTMAIFSYLDYNGFDLSVLHWIPVASLGFVIFISSVGVVPLTLICVVESLPNEARQFGLTVSVVTICMMAFASTKLFPILSATIHLYGCMTIYAVACAFGTVFLLLFFKETKGINLDTVGDEKKPKPSVFSNEKICD